MATKYPELFSALAVPFDRSEVKTRNQGGRVLSYVTARSVMTRLDEVLGPENWTATYEGWSEDAVVCRLTITLPDGVKLTKCDVGSYSRMSEASKATEPGDDDKGGFSDAFKRAAVLFGVGRHLYGDGVPSYATTATPEPVNGHVEPTPVKPAPEPLPGEAYQRRERVMNAEPKDGRSLYRWAKEAGEYVKVDLVKFLNCEGKLRSFPPRIVDWGPAETGVGVHLVRGRIARKAEPANA